VSADSRARKPAAGGEAPSGPGGEPSGRRIRLNRYLALCGAASRRGAMALVFAGRVQVNGETTTDPGLLVETGGDRVTLDGARVRAPSRWLYYALHKPRGVIVTSRDEQGRVDMRALLRRLPAHVFAVGRLDRDSEGLLLLTNHGELTEHLLHPRNRVERVYRVKVMPAPRPGQLARLAGGVPIGAGQVSGPAEVRLKRALARSGLLTITIREGKKREVRRMCSRVGLRVMRLRRIAFAGIRLGELPLGAHRPLTAEEIAQLRALSGLAL